MTNEMREVYHYEGDDEIALVAFDGGYKLAVQSGDCSAIAHLPAEQLTRLLYALRTERSKTVTAQLAASNDKAKH